jgi:DNA topoisomerase I
MERAGEHATDLTPAAEQAAEIAVVGGLRYVSDTMPGIRRRRRGRSFVYLRPDARRVRAPRELRRIASLAIPPAYRDVWICTDARGHLQATGRDARNRKQYRYHPRWQELRDSVKFERMIEFAQALPKLRRRLRSDLARPHVPREKVLALIVSLLDTTRVRIGNPEYARDNNSFGLSTLRNRHVSFSRDGRAVLSFRGKGGAPHEIEIDDRRLARIVRSCQELPGQQLFQYLDNDTGAVRGLDSGQVNEYLREAMGADFTAKDFRTWGATLRAIAILAATALPEPPTDTACRSCVAAVVKQVAAELRNTPAVCRKSYINPIVFAAWRRGALPAMPAAASSPRQAEKLALAFLRREGRTLKGAAGSR